MFFNPIIYLNENQILYTYSTLAQVIASLFGLFLAAYAILDPKLKDIGDKDQKSLDFVNEIRRNHFINMIVLSIACAISIILCILGLNCYNALTPKGLSFLLNQSIFTCTFSIMLFLLFGCVLLNPKSLSNIGTKEKKLIEHEFLSSEIEDGDHFRPYIAYYNKLENLISSFALELMQKDLGESDSQAINNRSILIFQALDILLQHEIINRRYYDIIDELRRYRNAIVHSVDDQTVNPKLFKQLKEAYQLLNDIYQQKDNLDQKQNCINDLYEFANEKSINEFDQAILEHIKLNPKSSISELASGLRTSKSYIHRKIQKLVKLGYINYDGISFKIIE